MSVVSFKNLHHLLSTKILKDFGRLSYFLQPKYQIISIHLKSFSSDYILTKHHNFSAYEKYRRK